MRNLKLLLTAFCLLAVSAWTVSVFLVQTSGAAPAAPPVEWVSQEGGVAVQQLADGSFILFGKTSLCKVDTEGNLVWKKVYGSNETSLDFRAGQQTTDGGYILIGGVPETARVGEIKTGDAFMQKTDETGNVLWNRTYGGVDHEYAFSGEQTDDGGYIVAGTYALSGVNHDFYLVKTDYTGTVIWSKTYGEASAEEVAWSVLETGDGEFIMAGEKHTLSENGTDAWVVKTDSNGNIVWSNTYGGADIDLFYRVRATGDGGYVFAGFRDRDPDSVAATGDFWLLRTSSDGSTLWEKSFARTGTGQSSSDVRQTSDGGYVAVGQTANGLDTLLIKTGSLGEELWEKAFTGRRSAVIQTNDRGFAITGEAPLIKIKRANPPVAAFTYEPLNPLVQQTITFNASDSRDLDDDISSFKWDFKDGYVTTTTNPVISHAFLANGVYNVTLTVTDGEDLTGVYAQEVSTQIYTSIFVSASSETVRAHSPVTLSGRLSDSRGAGLGNVPVSLSSSPAGSGPWTLIAERLTDAQGRFNVTWNPAALGTLTVRAEWEGNQTHQGSSNSTSIEVVANPTSLSLRLSRLSSDVGLRIAIAGNLSSDGAGLQAIPVLLSYSLTKGQTWNEISQPVTMSNGSYSASWTPMATGVYVVKAECVGNVTIQGTTATADLAVVEFDDENVFSVTSNSTISAISYESAYRELMFDVTGLDGTSGYFEVSLGKSLVEDIQGAQVKLNGTTVEYQTPSSNDFWILRFSYSHSTYSVVIRLDAGGFPIRIPITALAFLAVPIIAVGIAMLLLYIDKRQKGKERQAAESGAPQKK